MAIYMYITAGQGQTSPWGHNVFINIKCLLIRSFVIKLESPMLYTKCQDQRTFGSEKEGSKVVLLYMGSAALLLMRQRPFFQNYIPF